MILRTTFASLVMVGSVLATSTVEVAEAATLDALRIELAVSPVQLTTGPEAGNWEYIYDVVGDGTESQFDEWQLEGFDTSLIVNQVPGSPGIIQQKWDYYSANSPATWHRAAYGSYSVDGVNWLLNGHAGEILNTWHAPSDYSGNAGFLSAPRYTGAATIDGGGPNTVRLVSQITSGNLLNGLLATLRIVHPNAPGLISYNMYSFNNGGTNYIGNVAGPGSGCVIGDANCDGYVDIASDILTGFSNFTGPGSFGMTRAQGDVHGPTAATATNDPHDGDVDVSDILTMFGAFTGPPPDEGALAGPAAAGDPGIPDLIYDPTSGEVVLDADGSSIIGYSLKSAGAFLPGGHTPILGGVSTSLSTELAEAALSSSDGSIGPVFPTGLNLAGLSALLTENTVSTGLGAPLVPFDLVVLGPAVPEPASYALAAIGLGTLVYLGSRRKRIA